MKACSKCGAVKPLERFTRDRSTKSGYRSACSDCTTLALREFRARNLEKCRAHSRKHKARRIAEGVSVQVSRRKQKAHNLLKKGIKDGVLERASHCEVCGRGNVKIVGHHGDYKYPLVVEWLCERCHIAWHKLHGEGKNA